MTRRSEDVRTLLAWMLLLLLAAGGLLTVAQGASARPARQADGPLPPSTEPYVLGFSDPTAVAANWLPLRGAWSIQEQAYIQSDASAVNAASLYRRGIVGSYSIEVTLAADTGQAGGVVVNAGAANSLVFANVVRYRPDLGVLEVGEILADGSFQLSTTIDGAIPQDAGPHLLRVEVGEERYRIFFDDAEAGEFTLTNRPAVAYVGVYTSLGRIYFTDFVATVGGDGQDIGDLNPQQAPHVLNFFAASDLNLWRPGQGTWLFGDPGYVQDDLNAQAGFTYYSGRINGDFTLEAIFSPVEGVLSGGVLFNAAATDALADVMLVAFAPDAAESGGAIYWGYYDADGDFQEIDRADIDTPPDAAAERSLRITLTGDRYTLGVDGQQVGEEFSLPDEVDRVAGPYFGLYTSAARVRFAQVEVIVAESEVATATSIVATETPTPTATPTETPPPPAGSLLPRQEPYSFEFRALSEEDEGKWERYSGNWVFDDNGYTQNTTAADNAITFYEFKVFGDYDFEVDFRYLSTDRTGDVGAGLVFNAPNRGLEEAFIFAFRGLNDDDSSDTNNNDGTKTLVWGYFNADSRVFTKAENGDQSTGIAPPLTNGEQRTLRVEVEGTGYKVFLKNPSTNVFVNYGSEQFIQRDEDGDDTGEIERIDEPYIGLYAHKSEVRFENARVWVRSYANPTPTPTPTSPPTPTRGPTPTPDSNALPQRADAYTIGFSAPNSGREDSVAGWNPVDGQWRYERGYVGTGAAEDDSFSVFNRAIGRIPEGGDYTFEVTLQHVDGEMGGGIYFNAPGRDSLERAMVLRFVPDPSVPQIEWGYFSGNSFQRLGDMIAPQPEQIKTQPYRLRASVTSDKYSLAVNGSEIIANETLQPDSRHLQPFVGVYAANGSVRFTDAVIDIDEQVLPTATPTPTTRPVTPTNTPVPTRGPTETPTPTYTVTPGSPTPTNTLPPASPTNTPTPVVIAQGAAQPTATPVVAISTPLPSTPSLLQQTATAVAANATAARSSAQSFDATATAQLLFDAQTATSVALSPLTSPTSTPAVAAVAQPNSPLPAPADAGANTPQTGAGVGVLVVTNTPLPTQRPIEEPTPLPPPVQDSLFAQILASSARAAFWIWFVVGSIIFFSVAGLIFGLSMIRQSDEPYALLDAESAGELDELFPLTDPPAAAPSGQSGWLPPEDDNWPASLP